jgi:hypothetical protein
MPFEAHGGRRDAEFADVEAEYPQGDFALFCLDRSSADSRGERLDAMGKQETFSTLMCGPSRLATIV